MIHRIAECDICGKVQVEAEPGGGWNGWFGIQGIILNGKPNPMFCEDCKPALMNVIDAHIEKVKNGLD